MLSLLSALALLPGCKQSQYANPSFPLSESDAKRDLALMANHPVTLRRPAVVLGGWGDLFGLPPATLAKQLRQATGDDRITAVHFGGCFSFDACRERLIQHIQQAYPSDEPGKTTPVDIIGFSMGGIVARYAAAPPEVSPPPERLAQPQTDNAGHPIKRLDIARLFTISTPHRGALMATVLTPGGLARNMKPGAPFMQALDAHLANADYSVIPYVRLNDLIVGEFNAAPHGHHPHWLKPTPFTRSHADAYRDPRIVADLARRLRGETPYTTKAAALPE